MYNEIWMTKLKCRDTMVVLVRTHCYMINKRKRGENEKEVEIC